MKHVSDFILIFINQHRPTVNRLYSDLNVSWVISYVESHPSTLPGTTVSYCVIILSLMCHHCVTFKLDSRMLRIISYIKLLGLSKLLSIWKSEYSVIIWKSVRFKSSILSSFCHLSLKGLWNRGPRISTLPYRMSNDVFPYPKACWKCLQVEDKRKKQI